MIQMLTRAKAAKAAVAALSTEGKNAALEAMARTHAAITASFRCALMISSP